MISKSLRKRLWLLAVPLALLALTTSSNAQATLIGHWQFEEPGFADGAPLPSGGGLILDSSGNGNHGTVTSGGFFYESGAGDTFDPARSSQSIRNTGAGAIVIPTINLGSGGTPWTIELLLKKTSNAGSVGNTSFDDLLMTQLTNEAGKGSNFGLHIHFGGVNSQLQFFGNSANPLNAAVIPFNTWTHVAVTNDGSQYEFFLDGVSTGTASGTFHFNGLVIGFTDEDYVGFMDEVRVSNQVLDPSAFFINSVVDSDGDHFLCYEAEGNEVNVTVSLVDQFDIEAMIVEVVEVEEPELFCNPVTKTVGSEVTEIGDPTAHLTGYEIEDEGKEVERQVIVTNQFGDQQTLTVEEPELLFVPTHKLSVDGVPTGLDEPKALDHFKCYEAEGDPVNVTATLQDQFGIEPQVLVEEPELFCNPVAKNGMFPDDLINPESHLTCYKIKDEDEDEVERDVILNNQFGQGQMLEVEEPELLCVPSEKIDVVVVPEDDDDDDDDDDSDSDSD